MTALERLWLDMNPIADARVVSGMTKLEVLGLSDTRIVDLAPLVQNPGLGEGDEVNLRGLRIDSAFAASIAVLETRGVRVLVDPAP
jgi:Leucine-rich repeat (LRR) protein